MNSSSPLPAALVVGHGTRNPAGTAQLMELVAQIQSRCPDRCVRGSFLELAEPTIEQAVRELHAQGARALVIVPVLLFEAGHAKQDIPEAVEGIATTLRIGVLGQTPALGTLPEVIALSAIRFLEVQNARCLADHISSESIGLAMVGRGTSDVAALEHMRRFTQIRLRETPVRWHQTGFFAGGQPNVDQLLDQAAASPCDTIVVQPHLLFEGELMEQLRQRVAERQQSCADKFWLMARCLGADPALAAIYAQWISDWT